MNKVTSADTEQNAPKSNDWRSLYVNMAKADPNLRFTTLAHRLTPDFLYEAFRGLNRKAAPGPDEMTIPDYARGVDARIDSLHHRMVRGTYRAGPVRRVLIPKANGKTRPLGIANVEDRLVQAAIKNLLQPIYEQDFLDFSYGYRPGRSAHDALQAMRKTLMKEEVHDVVETDIKGFFDNLEHEWLRKFLRHRIADRGVLRLIEKFLNAGIVDEEGCIQRPNQGTPQGGPLSPLLANIYLHYALDLWFHRRFSRHCLGVAKMVRYADDFVVCFTYREDAERFLTAVQQRLEGVGLELEPAKTRLIGFGRDLSPPGPGPQSGGHTFDFLGFTFYLRKHDKRRRPVVGWKPSRKSRTRFLHRVREWLYKYRHLPAPVHRRKLREKLLGFYGYYGLRFCKTSLEHVRMCVSRLWKGALERRSQRGRISWKKLNQKPWFRLPRPGRKQKPKSGKRASRSRQMQLDFVYARPDG